MFVSCLDHIRQSLELNCNYGYLSSVYDLHTEKPTEDFITSEPTPEGFFDIYVAMEKNNLDSTSLPVPQFLVNNPNISITPTIYSGTNVSPKKQLKNRISRVVSPVSFVPVSCDHNQPALNNGTDSKKTTHNTKRTSSCLNSTSNRPVKCARLSVSKLPKFHKEKNKSLDSISTLKSLNKNNRITDIASTKHVNINAAAPSTSSSANRVPSELGSQQPTSTDGAVETNVKLIETQKRIKYQFLPDGKFSLNYLKNDTASNNQPIEIMIKQASFEITRPELMNDIILAISSVMNKSISKEELEKIKQTSDVLFPPEHNRPSETKEVPSTSSKLDPVNHNNISTTTTSKTQSNQQQPCSSKQPTTKSSPLSSTKQTTSSSSSKIQQSNTQNDVKHVSNNVKKHPIATVKQVQSINKQIMSNQLSTLSKQPLDTQVPIVTKQLITLPQGGKSAVFCQSSQDEKKCSKCKATSEDDICTTCRMSSQLKGVTVTRIQTPGTVPTNEVIALDDEEDVDITDLTSEDDEDNNDKNKETVIVEPVVERIESDQVISDYIDKLSSDPKILEEFLWQPDLGLNDFYKLEQCNSVHFGSFNASLVVSPGDIFICPYGIRMILNNGDSEPVIIDIEVENIVRVFGYYGESPTIFIYTNYLAAFGIQHLLKLNAMTDNKDDFDPLSNDNYLNKMILSFVIKKNEISKLERVLLKLPNRIYEPLTKTQANELIIKSSQTKEDGKKHQSSGSVAVRVNNETNDNYVLAEGLSSSKIKIHDYRMLGIDIFLNDAIIEYYLFTWFYHKLPEDVQKRTHVCSTFFYTVLSDPSSIKNRHCRIKRWTRHFNIFEKDFTFIPINESQHWFLAVICYPYLTGPVSIESGIPVDKPDEVDSYKGSAIIVPDEFIRPDEIIDGRTEDLRYFNIDGKMNKKFGIDYEIDVEKLRNENHELIKQPSILIFDSLNANSAISRAKTVGLLRDFIAEEYRDRNNGAERDFSRNILKAHLVKVPQQPNFSDCGLFLMHYCQYFFKRPIIDYSFPIIHLENWFSVDEVVYNCQKRREIQGLVLNAMNEQGRSIPPGYTLPKIKFTKTLPNSQNTSGPSNTANQYHNSHHHNQNQNRLVHDDDYYHNHVEMENSEEELSDQDLEDSDEILYSDDDDYHSRSQNNAFPSGYMEDNDLDEYQGYEFQDQREYLNEMGEPIEEWSDEHNVDDEEYVEEDYDDVQQMGQYNHMRSNSRNIVVNLDDPCGSSSSHRSHANYQNVSNSGLRSYRMSNHRNEGNNHVVVGNVVIDDDDDDDDVDEDEEDDEEEDDDDDDDNEPNQSTNYSKKHNQRN